MKTKAHKYKLRRALGLWQTTVYGVGIILGAGIYALIGVGAGIAGNALWISFLIAAAIAACTGLSYAELSSMFPKEAPEYVYTKAAFKRPALSFIISWAFILVSIIAASTVALAFGNYWSFLFGGSPLLVAALLIIVLTILNWWGIKESAGFNTVATLLEASGLVLIVLVGIWSIRMPATDWFETPHGIGIGGIMAATALIFFAYIGFEDVAGIAEEVKRPRRTIPRALLLSLAISTALYIAVTVAAIGVLGWERLSASPAPLADVMSSAFGQGAGTLLAFIALAATSNTVLISLICGSRVLYGVASHDGLPRQLAMIGKRRTPTLAVFFAGFFALVALFISDIRTIAELTDVGIFIIYFAVNASLIWLRFKNPSAKRPFKSPSIGRIPIVALIGAFGCVLLLFSINPLLLAGEAALLAIGFVIYKIIKARQQR